MPFLYPPAAGSAQRVAASGSTVVAANSTVTLATVTRNTNERFQVMGFVTNNTASLDWQEGAAVTVGLDGVNLFLERTANADEFNVRCKNDHNTLTRTVNWLLLGIVP